MTEEGLELANGYVSLEIDPQQVGPGVRKALVAAEPEADRAGKAMGKRFGGVFSSTSGKLLAGAGGIFAVAKVKDLVGESIGIASDLNEATTKLDAIFGGASKTVQQFASGGAKALGQSRGDVLDAAATFGVFGKAAGLQGPKLAKFSTHLTKLSTDLASFHNADPSEVVDALGAALRGEAEPMRRFGVMLNDATLKAEAMSLGILLPVKDRGKIETAMARLTVAQSNYNDAVKEHGKESIEAIRSQASLGSAQNTLKKATEGTIPALTSQQKTLAAQSLIFKQTRDAQGDFAKTSDGLANQQRILGARFEDVKGKIGKGFLPVALEATDFLNEKAAPAIENFIDEFSTGKGKGGKVRELFQDIRDTSKDAAKFIGNVAQQFNDLPDPVKKGALFGAIGLGAAKKTGLLGSPNTRGGAGSGLLGLVTKAKPLPVFVVNQVPGAGLGPAAGGLGAGSAAGGAGAAAAGGRMGLLRLGAGGALASLGGVRTYDLSKPNPLGIQKLPWTKELDQIAKDRTGIDNVVKSVAALDRQMSSLALQNPKDGLRFFKQTAEDAKMSTEELAAVLPKTADSLERAGINAKTADGKVFGLENSVRGATRELKFLAQQQPQVTIKSNIKDVRKDVFNLKRALEEATVTRTARIRIATSGDGFNHPGLQAGGNNYAGRGGPTFTGPINIEAHDYNDFQRQLQDRTRRRSAGGVR